MRKVILAFVLGLLAFPVVMFFGEALGVVAGLAALAVFFFACQFFLSRRHPDAFWRDWRIMLALNAFMIVTIVIMTFVEEQEVVLSQGAGILLGGCGGTLAGALVASRVARKAAEQG